MVPFPVFSMYLSLVCSYRNTSKESENRKGLQETSGIKHINVRVYGGEEHAFMDCVALLSKQLNNSGWERVNKGTKLYTVRVKG